MFDLAIPLQLTSALLPDLVVMGGALLLLLVAAWRPDSAEHQRTVGLLSVTVCMFGIAAVIFYMGRGYSSSNGVIAVDGFRWMIDLVVLLGTIAAILLSIEENDRQGMGIAETHVLILFAASGMMLLAAARDLMIIFLGVELMSVAIYALAGLNRRSARGAEGALKYFLLGAFSSAFLLYGIALIYGATGTTNLPLIGERILDPALREATGPLLLIGLAMLLVGFGFKVSSVPFHMWAPDVYEGSPAAITAYMAATVKAAAFATFVRVWLEAFPMAFPAWYPPLALLAVLTMVIGNAVGLAQKNLKRLLAYSSIGHAGYLLVAIAANTGESATAVVFYLLAYTLATFGAFAVVLAVGRGTESNVTLDELSGLWHERPWLAVGMTVFMLALLGFPVFGGAGFLAKWYVIKAVLNSPTPPVLLAVVLVLTSVVAAGYYLYVVMVMFMRPRPAAAAALPRSGAFTRTVAVTAAVAIIVLGLFPDFVVRATSRGWVGAGQPPALAATTSPPAALPVR
jgi:NADH-quinone oxidoreductase subunit N